jgi:hypothetical protein
VPNQQDLKTLIEHNEIPKIAMIKAKGHQEKILPQSLALQLANCTANKSVAVTKVRKRK